MKEKFRRFLEDLSQKENTRRILVIAGLAGIALIALSSLFSGGSDPSAEEIPAQSLYEDYEEALREKIEEMVRAITGEEEVLAAMTFERAGEAVYAADQKGASGERSYIVLRKTDGSQTLQEVTSLTPQLRGIAVICKKGGDPLLRERITEAVSTALGIPSHKVCVLEYHEEA